MRDESHLVHGIAIKWSTFFNFSVRFDRLDWLSIWEIFVRIIVFGNKTTCFRAIIGPGSVNAVVSAVGGQKGIKKHLNLITVKCMC